MTLFVGTVRLGKDAERRTTQSGKECLAFTAAYDTGFGEYKETTWLQCACWMPRMVEGELINYLTKGTQVVIYGEPSIKKWTNREGVDRQDLTIRVSDIDLVGSREQPQRQAAPAPSRRQAPAAAPAPAKDDFGDFDDDIPF